MRTIRCLALLVAAAALLWGCTTRSTMQAPMRFRENFDQRRVPSFNFSKKQTLASMERIDQPLQSERA